MPGHRGLGGACCAAGLAPPSPEAAPPSRPPAERQTGGRAGGRAPESRRSWHHIWRNCWNSGRVTRSAASAGGMACSGGSGRQHSGSTRAPPHQPSAPERLDGALLAACTRPPPRLHALASTFVQVPVPLDTGPTPSRPPSHRLRAPAHRAAQPLTSTLSRYWSTCLSRAHDTTLCAKSRAEMEPCGGARARGRRPRPRRRLWRRAGSARGRRAPARPAARAASARRCAAAGIQSPPPAPTCPPAHPQHPPAAASRSS